MREQIVKIGKRFGGPADPDESSIPSILPLRAAAAKLTLTTAAAIAADYLASNTRQSESSRRQPLPLRLAPLAVAPITAAAQLEHSRRPRQETATALKILNTATVAIGGALLLYELFDEERSVGSSLASSAYLSTGVLGHLLDAHEKALGAAEAQLRRRARIIDRWVPRRRAKLDRIVVHV